MHHRRGRRFGGLLLMKALCGLMLLTPGWAAAQQRQGAEGGSVTGTVRDTAGAAVGEAEVALVNAQQLQLGRTRTDAEGRFRFDGVAPGSYVLTVSRRDFTRRREPVRVTAGALSEVSVVLEVNQLAEEVTVTAETGLAEDKDRVPQQVNVISEDAILQRATAQLAQVADEEVGISLQRTSPTIGAVLVRGLTEVGV